MTTDNVIDTVAREFADFCLEDAEEETSDPHANYCRDARIYDGWTADLLSTYVYNGPSLVSLTQAKVLLVDSFFDWRSSVPKSHRNRIGENGHFCIFHVFERAMHKIRLAQLTLSPPQLFVPAPPLPTPSPPQIAGIFLGEGE